MFGLLYDPLMPAAIKIPPRPPANLLAMILIRAERERQIDVEGYTPEHDLQKPGYASELLKAAIAYRSNHSEMWPWGGTFKPKDPIRNLVRAGALVLAALEVLEATDDEMHRFQRDQADRALEMTVAQLVECITSLQALAEQQGWEVTINGDRDPLTPRQHQVLSQEDEDILWQGRVDGQASLSGICGLLGISHPEGDERFKAFLTRKAMGRTSTPHDKLAHLKAATSAGRIPFDAPGCPACAEGTPMTTGEAIDLYEEQHDGK